MKINMIKTANGKFWPADEESVDDGRDLKVGEVYSCEIKLNHNYKLLQKIHVFFKYCAQHYWGDENVDKHQIKYTKNNLLIAAGYARTLVDPRTGFIEITAESISYPKMKEEDRRKCYSKIITAAMQNVFHDCSVETENKLISFF